MSIQWFPGHMTRARREIEQKLKQIDLVIELLDARIPMASRNPMIDDILKKKPRMVVLNKADLSDPELTERWVEYFKEDEGISAIPFDSTSGRGAKMMVARAKEIMKPLIDKQMSKGITPRAIRALIVGIPNVGKSTLINRLAGKQIAVTGDRPGVTKGQQWIKVGTEMELLDTPGILWPKFEDPEVGLMLAATGAIREEILDVQEIAFHSLRFLIRYYPDRLQKRFGLEEISADTDNPQEVMEVLEDIGKKRGCLRSGGMIDLDKASGILLREMRAGKLGKLSLEAPLREE